MKEGDENLLTRRQKRILKRVAKRYTCKTRDRLAERQALKGKFLTCSELGLVAVVRRGMDISGKAYWSTQHIATPTSVYDWEKAEEIHKIWMNGPEHVRIARPSEEPEAYTQSDMLSPQRTYTACT